MDLEEVVLITWRNEGAILVDALVAMVVPEADEMDLLFIVTTAKSQAIQSIRPPFEREPNERCTRLCHYSMSLV